MKLIDLLVQELPKRGGWPGGVFRIEQASNGRLFEMESDYCSEFALQICESWIGDKVTKFQYEEALVASRPQWDGDGLPPVGCECECHVDEGVIHCVVVGYDFDKKAVVMRNVPDRKYFSIQAISGRIKPLRTEAERKREEAGLALYHAINWNAESEPGPARMEDYKKAYDAIAEGRIPGVKLEG